MKGRARLFPDERADIGRRYGAGEKVDALAVEYGVHNFTVLYHARAAGHAPRRPWQARKAHS